MDELRERLDSLEAKQTQVKEDGRLSPTGREEALKELEGQINATWQEIESTYNERMANFDKQIGAVMKGTPVPDIPLETMMTENREADRLIGRLTLAGSPKTFLGVIEEAARGTVQSRNAIFARL